MATAPPLVIKVPPAPAKKGTVNAFDKFMSAHPALQQYKVAIQQWAGEYGVPAIWVAATLAFEGGYDKKTGAPTNQPNAKGTGFGLAQINPKTWFGKTFPPTGETITPQWASQPGNAINFASWLLSSGMATGGTLANTYKQTYNPGYTGTGPEGLLKGLAGAAVSVGHTPQQKAAGSAATQQAALSNRADQLKTTKRALDPIYLAYTGRPSTVAEVEGYLKNPTSTYQIELQLADPKNNRQIYSSPVWQTNAPRYQQYYRDVFGTNAQVPQQAILYGIVHSLDETAFKGMMAHGQLPGQKPYMQSEEYKGLAAQYRSQFAQIYGAPGQGGEQLIHDAVVNGWTADQWNQYLRSRPEYTSSDEYKARAIDLARSMGLLQNAGGAQTVLGGGSAGADQQAAQAGSMQGPAITAAQAGAFTPMAQPAAGVQSAAAKTGAAAGAAASTAGRKVGAATRTAAGAIRF